jgi:hypothetical protein
MNRMCRETVTQVWRRRQLAISDLLHHAKIVTDPNILQHLNAQVAKRKAALQSERPRGESQLLSQGGCLARSDPSHFDRVR